MTKDMIFKELRQIIKEDQVEIWLNTPNSAFNDKTPNQLIESGQPEGILRMIGQITNGVAS